MLTDPLHKEKTIVLIRDLGMSSTTNLIVHFRDQNMALPPIRSRDLAVRLPRVRSRSLATGLAGLDASPLCPGDRS